MCGFGQIERLLIWSLAGLTHNGDPQTLGTGTVNATETWVALILRELVVVGSSGDGHRLVHKVEAFLTTSG